MRLSFATFGFKPLHRRKTIRRLWELGFRIGPMGLLAVRPDSRAFGHLAFETKFAISLAKQEGCFLYLARAPGSVNPSICELNAPGVRRVPNFWPLDYLITFLARRQRERKLRQARELVEHRRYLRRPEVLAQAAREKERALRRRDEARAQALADLKRRRQLGLPGEAAGAAEAELRLRLLAHRARLRLLASIMARLLRSPLARRLPEGRRRWIKRTMRYSTRELGLPRHLQRIGGRPGTLLVLRLRPLGERLAAQWRRRPAWPIRRIRILDPHDPIYYRRDLMCAPVYAALPERMKRRGDAIAAELGVGPDQPVVTLHFRESGFKQGRSDTENTRLNLQNTSFENGLPAIRDLVARGYVVVRLGDSSMRPVSEPGVVDLATSPLRQPFLDPYFIARSEFMIGCDSGPAIAAWLLGTPLIYMNASHPAHCWPLGPRDLLVPKYIRVLADGHYQSLEEMCTLEAVEHFRDPAFLEYQELTAADFHEGVKEMLDRVCASGSLATSPMQDEFERLCASFLELPDLPNYLKKWACKEGFLGHGTIARFVVERNRRGGWAPAEQPARATVTS